METEIERLVVRLVGDGAKYQDMLRTVSADTTRAADHIEREGTRIGGLGFGLRRFALQTMGALTPLIGGLSLIGGAFKGVQLAAEAESMESSFKVMLGSAGAARKMVADLQKFAAETPLNLGPLQGFTRMLLQAGVGVDSILPTLKSLGDVALGDASKLHGLVYAFGQVKTFGRLMGGELIQLRNAGFDPLAEISRISGKSIGVLRQEMEKGLISFKMVEDAFKSASGEGGRFKDGMKEAAKTLSGLFSTMQDDLNAFFRTLGTEIVQVFKLKEVMLAVSSAAQQATDFFKSLSPEVKTLVTVIAVATTAAAAFFLIWPMISGIAVGAVTSLATAIGFLLGPIDIIGVAVVGLAALIVRDLGGTAVVWKQIQEAASTAWDSIQQRTNEFLIWVTPIWQALLSVAAATWDGTKQIAIATWGVIAAAAEFTGNVVNEIWRSITDGAVLDWGKVRDTIVDVLLVAEFVLRNFGDYASFVWTKMQLDFIRFANQVEYFFTKVIPTTFNWFVENWRDIFTDLFNWTKTVFSNLGQNIVEMVKKIPDLIKGNLSFEDWSNLWKPLEEGFKRATKELLIPDRVLGELEKQLEKQLGEQAHGLVKAFQAFRDERLKQFADERNAILPPKVVEEAEDAAKKIGEAIEGPMTNAKNEAKSMNAVLIGSAEALSRIYDARDAGQFWGDSRRSNTRDQARRLAEQMVARVEGLPVEMMGPRGFAMAPGLDRPEPQHPLFPAGRQDLQRELRRRGQEAVEAPWQEMGRREQDMVGLLQEIRDLNRQLVDDPGIEVEAAALVA